MIEVLHFIVDIIVVILLLGIFQEVLDIRDWLMEVEDDESNL